MEKPEEVGELGEDRSGGSKLIWERGENGKFKVYYDKSMMCPYVLCLHGHVHAMFSTLDEAIFYVWECWL